MQNDRNAADRRTSAPRATDGAASAMLLLAILAGIAMLQQSATSMPGAALAVSAASLFVFGCLAVPRQLPELSSGWQWTAGAAAALLIGAWFRTIYLDTVPSGWNDESIAFLRFARHLVDAGFPYEPYAWYAHTLYSYLIALVLLFVPAELTAFRIASALISLATLGVVFAQARLWFGMRVATITTILLASSHWHFFASRNGYHQQLLPLFQGLFLYGLARGVRTGSFGGLLLASAALVIGLHAHWGFYLMLPYAALWCVYVWRWQATTWQAARRSVAIAAVVAVVWAIPLGLFFAYNAHLFDYVFKGFSLAASAASHPVAKWIGNLRYVAWALSGTAGAPVEFGTQVDPLVAAAAGLGWLVCLRRWRSIAHATLLLLGIVQLAGLALTMANSFYLTALLLPVYTAAGVGLAAVAERLPRRRVFAALAAVIFVAMIATQLRLNYDEIFRRRIFVELKNPLRPPGTLYVLLDQIRPSIGRRAVFLARDEPGRDFDAPLFALASEVPSFGFVGETRPYHFETVVFPAALTGGLDEVEIWLPNAAAVELVQIPLLRALYPSLEVTVIRSPAPYVDTYDAAIAYRVVIPAADLAPYRDRGAGEPLLSVPHDGRFRFRWDVPASWSPQSEDITLHGQPLVDAADGHLLEAGLHPLVGVTATSLAHLLWSVDGDSWQPVDASVIQMRAQQREWLRPYLAPAGRSADFVYQQRLALPPRAAVRAVWIEADGSFVSAGPGFLRWHASDGEVRREIDLGDAQPLLLNRVGPRLVLIHEDGSWVEIESGAVKPGGEIGCRAAELLDIEGEATVLCLEGELRTLQSSGPPPSPGPRSLAAARSRGILAATDAASIEAGFRMSDEQSGRLAQFDAAGGLQGWRVMSGLYFGSEVESDPRGNLFVKRWPRGIKTYAGDGALLFHPRTGRPSLMQRGADLDADATALRRLRFHGRHAIAIGMHDIIYVFDRIEIPRDE